MISILFAFVSLLDRIPVPADIADSVICSDEQVADSCDDVASGINNCVEWLRIEVLRKGLILESPLLHEPDGFYRMRLCRVPYTNRSESDRVMKRLAQHFREIYDYPQKKKEVNEKPRR